MRDTPKTTSEMRAKVKESWDHGSGTSDPEVHALSSEGGVGWCDEGSNELHPGADVCFRQISSYGGPGQQCCYAGESLLTEGAGAGTPDQFSAAFGLKSNGRCAFDLFWAHDHYDYDVRPFKWLLKYFAIEFAAEAYHYGKVPSRIPKLSDLDWILYTRGVTVPTEFGWPPSGSTAEVVFSVLHDAAVLKWEIELELGR